MERCKNCASERTNYCAAVWAFDDSVIASIRSAQTIAQRDHSPQISIAHFVLALSENRSVRLEMQARGIDVDRLQHEIAQLASRNGHRTTQRSRLSLSQSLNELLVAAEHSASITGSVKVSLDILFATMVCNAGQDKALACFAHHGRALSQSRRSELASFTQHAAFVDHASQENFRGRERLSAFSQQQVHNVDAAFDIRVRDHGAYQSANQTAGRLRVNAGVHNGESDQQRSRTSARSAAQSGYDRQTREQRGRDSRQAADRDYYQQLLQIINRQEARLDELECREHRAKRAFKVTRLRAGGLRGRNKRAQSKSDTAKSSSQPYSRASTPNHTRTNMSNEGDRSRSRQFNASHERKSGATHGTHAHNSYRSHTHTGQERTDTIRTQVDRAWQPSQGNREYDDRTHRQRGEREARNWNEQQHANRSDKQHNGRNREDNNHQRRERDNAHEANKKEKRFYLSLDDDLVEAPSIGPKTAARFTPLGIRKVRDLLELDVEAVARKLNVRHITADVLAAWQDQARLVCSVPWLRGTHAQLLVGADYRSAADLQSADLGEVLAGILRFAATNQGERVLRNNPPPEREKVQTWLNFAKQAEPHRAA